MADVEVKASDPYEFYRDTPADINDPKLREELKMNPILPDDGKEVHITSHISNDELHELNDQGKHNHPERTERIREMLHNRGIDTPHPRGRTYSIGR